MDGMYYTTDKMMVGMLVKNFSEMKKDHRYRIIAVK